VDVATWLRILGPGGHLSQTAAAGGRPVAGNTRVLDTEAVWIRGYTVVDHPAKPGTLAASWATIAPLRIRPVPATLLLAASRRLDAAFCYRAADFFRTPDDQRKAPARQRFIELVRGVYGIGPRHMAQVPYQDVGGGSTTRLGKRTEQIPGRPSEGTGHPR
jgi:hypothetical protein